jgi:hypothetical protein
MVEHLADCLADEVQGATAAGACLVLDIEAPILAWQVRRQSWPFILHLRCPGPRREPGFGPREISVEVLQGELQLITIKLLGPSAKLVALQLLG